MKRKTPIADQNNKYSKNVIRELSRSENLKREGKFEEALEIAQKVLEKDPGCLAAAEEVADNLLSLDRLEEAKKAADFVYSMDTKSYIANYVLGFLLLGENKNQEALKYLKEGNQYSPNNPEILRCLGWSLFHVGQHLPGILTLERALNLRNDDPLILCDLGVCYLHLNDFQKTTRLFERALALDPNNKRAQECLVAAMSLEQELKNAQKNAPSASDNPVPEKK